MLISSGCRRTQSGPRLEDFVDSAVLRHSREILTQRLWPAEVVAEQEEVELSGNERRSARFACGHGGDFACQIHLLDLAVAEDRSALGMLLMAAGTSRCWRTNEERGCDEG